MVPALINDDYVVRFCVNAQNANDDDIIYAWNVISETASDVLEVCDSNKEGEMIIERIASIELDDETMMTKSIEKKLIDLENENEKFETEENEDDDVFLYDNNIPSIPSIPQSYNGIEQTMARRNRLLRMISDPKCYSPRILKSLSQKDKRHKSDDSAKSSVGGLKEGNCPTTEV